MSEMKHTKDVAEATAVVERILKKCAEVINSEPTCAHSFVSIGILVGEKLQVATASVGHGDIANVVWNGIKVFGRSATEPPPGAMPVKAETP